ncbi:MAG: acyltransferase [Albidovulum sp.]
MNAMGGAGTTPGKAYFGGLTALRGFAAMMVVLVHVWGIHQFALPDTLINIIPHLTLGVPLFFVISAFSLFVSTTARIDQPGWLNDFLTRRFMRIAPLFYLVALWQLLVLPVLVGSGMPVAKFLLTISFLFNFMPGQHESLVWAGWSVGVEMMFYLILPLLLVTIRSLRGAAIMGAFLFVVSGAFIDHYRKGDFPTNFDSFSFFSALGMFGAGIVGYFLFQRLKKHPQARAAGLVTLGLAVVLGGLIVLNDQVLRAQPVIMGLWWAYPFALLVVSQCLRPLAIIANRPFIHLGDLSFSLYLLHPPIIYFAKPIYEWLYATAGSPGLGYGLSVLATLVMLYPLAWLTFHLIEKPGIRLGERIIARRRLRMAVSEVYAKV